MSLNIEHSRDNLADPLDLVEACLESAGWEHQRDEESTLQCIAQSRWGEMGALFASRIEPPALHFTLTLDLKPTRARQQAIAKLVLMANERLWLGHFDYWIEDGVMLFRHTIPMLDRLEPDPGEIRAVLAAATDAVNMFVPAFNFVIWAGKSPEEAIDAALFETDGEA
ncbi:type III secretion system chaperone family protein [Henriciella aquimarina]|uniref:YbjN domain-containing protein n=1 Tax=Henriciella aquimarina TaxID=545261 RepID=UPI0009FFE663|nr:YbjN domain-containing protein [Henriciella aquimarina]